MNLFYLIYGIITTIIIITLIIIIILQNKKINITKKGTDNLNEDLDFNKEQIICYQKQIEMYEEKDIEKHSKSTNSKQIKIKPIYKGKKALIGDYYDDSAKCFKELLNKFGFTVEIVQSGEDIIKRIKHGFKYDIIFTNNVYKGGEDGPMVLRHLRQIENFNTPIVIHSFSVDEKDHFLNYFKFDGFLKKQAEPEELKYTLEKIFNKNKKKGNKNNG